MKHIILFILSIFIFLGCAAQKTITVDSVKKPKIVNEHYETVEEKEIEINFDENEDFKVAIIFPSKVVGKYANNTINTILGYLLYKDIKFQIETFDSQNQEYENIKNSFAQLKEKGYKKVIALYTKDALPTLLGLEETKETLVYFPLINKNEAINSYEYFIYGAISYEEQLKKLLMLSNEQNSMFYEESKLGNKLKNFYETIVSPAYLSKSIRRIDTKYKKLVDDENLNESTLVLNTPIIKSSIILSQLRVHDIKPNIILSTQLNYNPLLVSLTQFEDRVNFITANSIEKTDNVLTETLSLLNADINYNWVNHCNCISNTRHNCRCFKNRTNW